MEVTPFEQVFGSCHADGLIIQQGGRRKDKDKAIAVLNDARIFQPSFFGRFRFIHNGFVRAGLIPFHKIFRLQKTQPV